MTSPILSLRAAIRGACLSDAPLAVLMDPEIRDEPPAGAGPVHAVFGEVDLADASTSTERGHEQDLTIILFAKPGSAASGLAAGERLVALLDDRALPLPGHRLVSLASTGIETRRESETGTATVRLRFRAITEQMP